MKYMSENGFTVYMISSPGNNIKALEKKENCQFIEVKMYRLISPFKDVVSLYKLIKVIKKIKPSIVHTHTPKIDIL